MSEPVPITVGHYWFGYTVLNFYARQGSAVSAEAQDVSRAASAVVEAAQESVALFGAKAAAISRLKGLANECAEPGWDGEDACAIEPIALQNAEDFIRAMPEDLPAPECAPEPDGSISLDWIQSRYRLFSVSVGSSHRLAYAWLDGSDKGHGVAHFDGFSIPPPVLFGIRAILNQNHGIPSFWVT